MMVDEARIHSWSFVSTLCKHIDVPIKKIYQLFLLLRRQLSSDLKKLFWIISHSNLLQTLTFHLLGQLTSK